MRLAQGPPFLTSEGSTHMTCPKVLPGTEVFFGCFPAKRGLQNALGESTSEKKHTVTFVLCRPGFPEVPPGKAHSSDKLNGGSYFCITPVPGAGRAALAFEGLELPAGAEILVQPNGLSEVAKIVVKGVPGGSHPQAAQNANLVADPILTQLAVVYHRPLSIESIDVLGEDGSRSFACTLSYVPVTLPADFTLCTSRIFRDFAPLLWGGAEHIFACISIPLLLQDPRGAGTT